MQVSMLAVLLLLLVCSVINGKSVDSEELSLYENENNNNDMDLDLSQLMLDNKDDDYNYGYDLANNEDYDDDDYDDDDDEEYADDDDDDDEEDEEEWRRIGRAFRRVGRSIGRGFRRVGRSVGRGFRRVGRTIGRGIRRVRFRRFVRYINPWYWLNRLKCTVCKGAIKKMAKYAKKKGCWYATKKVAPYSLKCGKAAPVCLAGFKIACKVAANELKRRYVDAYKICKKIRLC